jgi:hypothetical protein
VEQLFPPRPTLFVREVLVLEPSSVGQFFSNFWITDSHCYKLFPPSMPESDFPGTIPIAQPLLPVRR